MSLGNDRAISRLGLLLIAAALAMRVLIPAGFMPGMTGAGGPAITLCTGQGMVTVASDRPDPTSHQDKRTDHPCAFAAAGGMLIAPQVALPIAPVARDYGVVRPIARIRPGRGLAAPPPWQTGPPLLA